MTTDRDFDRLARAWLEAGPDEAPDRVIAAVLQAAETTPQVRRGLRRPFRRPVTMTRLSMAAVLAVAILAAGGGILYIGSQRSTSVVAPTPPPTAVPSTSATASTPVPADLRSTWIGPPRTVPGLLTAARYRFELTDGAFRFPLDELVRGQLQSTAAVEGGDTLRLVSTETTGGCRIGDIGTYAWSQSPSRSKLTLTLTADACTVRGTAVPGVWQRVGCKNADDACFGDLAEAGTYPSQYFTPRRATGVIWQPQWGALTYTVPSGWANSADWPNSFVLTPSDSYALEGPDGSPDGTVREVSAFRLPVSVTQDAACAGPRVPGSPTTVDGLIGYVRGLKSVTASVPTSMTIDARPAKWIDVTIAPAWKESCPDAPSGQPVALLLGSGDPAGSDDHVIGLLGAEKARLVFVDVGGQVVLIVVDSSDPARFDDLTAQAMPIVESFQFK